MRGVRGSIFGAIGCALLWVLLWPSLAKGHQSSLVYAEVNAQGKILSASFKIANSDLFEALALGKDRPATEAEARAGEARLSSYVLSKVILDNGGQPCPGRFDGMSLMPRTEGFFALISVHYQCQRSLEEATLTYNLFFDLDPRHQGIVHIRAFGVTSEHVFRERARKFYLSHPLSTWDNVKDYLDLGIEHIFSGYDHLAFLLGLLLVATTIVNGQLRAEVQPSFRSSLRYVVGIVTAFTIAHSVTLIISALGVITVPSRPVEVIIAASIGYVAVENLLQQVPKRRFLLTFLFGLIHGFGFSSVLREIGLPKKGLLISLLSFNLGVEIGQLVVVAIALPILHGIALLGARSPNGQSQSLTKGLHHKVRTWGSVILLLFSAYWLTERLFFAAR